MALSPGTRIGPYEILAPIGAGGMGEVYKARDTRLDRFVAIKILSLNGTAPERNRERLAREARAIARLSHPHICALFDIGIEGETDYLVMELLEGETLAQRLARGALPLPLALEYARQIAEALDAAHHQGIVHRDLKPSNVMLTKDGVKVLDFGLAKHTSKMMRSFGDSESPTKQKELTEEHALVGTLQYMAPEQLEGRDIDHRTDVFAFGAVLYEMLTGLKAFSGKSQANVIAAILDSDPSPIESSARLREVLKRCLAKSPDDRWQSLADLSVLLQWTGDSEQTEQKTRRRRWLVPAGLGLIFSVLLGTVIWLRRSDGTASVVRLSLDLPSEHFLGNGVTAERTSGGSRPSRTAIALSPDGAMLVFTAIGADGQARLFARRLESREAIKLEGTQGAAGPVFSPDGAWVAFWADGELKTVEMGGGLPVPLCKTALTFGSSWGSDGHIVFAGESGGLWRVRDSGGEPQPITTLEGEEQSHRLPHYLPNGQGVLFTVMPSSWKPDEGTVELLDLSTRDRKHIVNGGSDAQYAKSGHVLYAGTGVVMAVPFDLARMISTGAAMPALSRVMQATGAANTDIETGAIQFSFSNNGTLAYVEGGPHPVAERKLMWLDRAGREEPADLPSGPWFYPRVSNDGASVALENDLAVWVHDLRRGSSSRLTLARVAIAPLWSPDDRQVAYLWHPGGESPPGIFAQASDRSGSPTRLSTGFNHRPASWSSDSRFVVFVADDDLWALDVSELTVEPILRTPFIEMYPAISPDGRWLAYTSNESGRQEVYVQAFPGPGATYPISTAGGHSPSWARSGKELFYLQGDPALGRHVHDFMAVEVSSSAVFSASRPQRLFRKSIHTANPLRNYDVAPDGRFLVMTPYDPPTEKVVTIQVVLNWFEELKRLAPAEN